MKHYPGLELYYNEDIYTNYVEGRKKYKSLAEINSNTLIINREKERIFIKLGIDRLNDPLIMQETEVVWLQGDIYLNKNHSLDYLNRQASIFYHKFNSYNHDPFNP